jgi:hypothetical protein
MPTRRAADIFRHHDDSPDGRIHMNKVWRKARKRDFLGALASAKRVLQDSITHGTASRMTEHILANWLHEFRWDFR